MRNFLLVFCLLFIPVNMWTLTVGQETHNPGLVFISVSAIFCVVLWSIFVREKDL